MKKVRKITFDGIEYYSGEFQDFIDFILINLKNGTGEKTIIVHINLRNYYFLQKDSILKDQIKNNCISIFEGIGMKVGFFLKGYGFLPDLNGTDLIPLLLTNILNSNYKLFLLGAEEEIVVKAINNLNKRFPGLNICGYNNGYFSEKYELELLKKINESNADILLIGMGFPKQEKFVLKYHDKLKTSLIWNVGGLFDTLSGHKKRAPVMLRKIRLEWLFRFVHEPGRMLHRNTVAAIGALSHIIFSRRGKLL